MKGIDLIHMAPAIAFAGGLAGLMQHAARPGETHYLITSIIMFLVGVGTFGALVAALARGRNLEDQ